MNCHSEKRRDEEAALFPSRRKQILAALEMTHGALQMCRVFRLKMETIPYCVSAAVRPVGRASLSRRFGSTSCGASGQSFLMTSQAAFTAAPRLDLVEPPTRSAVVR